MAEVVNLRAARKAKDRAKGRVLADHNAAKHGRSKAAKALEAARAEKVVRDLDGAKRE